MSSGNPRPAPSAGAFKSGRAGFAYWLVLALWLALTTFMAALPVFAAAGHSHSQGTVPNFDFSMYGFEGLQKVMNVHPAFVHFPIALFPLTLLFYGLGVWLKKPPLLIGGRMVLYLAVISLAITVYTGLRAEESIPHNQEIHRMIETHKNTGWVLLIFGGLLTLWSFWHSGHRPRGAWLFLLTAAFASYLVLQNGDIGSRMVYLQGAGVKPAVSAVTGEEQKEKGGGNSESESGHKH